MWVLMICGLRYKVELCLQYICEMKLISFYSTFEKLVDFPSVSHYFISGLCIVVPCDDDESDVGEQ